MSLEKREMEIPLSTSLDLKSGREGVDASASLSEVTNLRWNRAGAIEKRPTYASEATPSAPSGATHTRCKLTTLLTNQERVVALTDNHGICYPAQGDDTTIDWPAKSLAGYDVVQYAPVATSVSRRVLERTQFGAEQNGIYTTASALYQGTLVFAWIEVEKATVRLKAKAVDVKTGKIVTATYDALLTGATGYSVQACEYTATSKEGVLITYCYGSGAPFTVRTLRWDAATKAFATDSNLTTNSKYTNHSVTQSGQQIYFTFTDNTSNVVKAHLGTVATINGGSSTVHTGTTTGVIPGTVVVGDSYALVVTYDSTHVYAERYGTPASVTTAISAEVSSVPTSEGFLGVTAAIDTPTANVAVVYVNCYATEPAVGITYRVRTRLVDFNSTTLSLSTADIIPNAWLATAAFSYGQRAHVGVLCGDISSGEPGSVLVLRHHVQNVASNYDRHDLIARVCHDRYYSPSLGVFGGHAQVSTDGDGSFFLVLVGDPSEDDAEFVGSPLPQSLFLSTMRMAQFAGDDGVNPAMPLPYAESDGVTSVASGVLFDFDGDTVAESSPVTRPQCFVDTSNAGSVTVTNQLYVRAIWRWVDNRGRLHRSAPSDQVIVNPMATQRIDVYVTKPPVTALDGYAVLQTLEPELYVTEDSASASTFYLAQNTSGEKLTYADEYTWNTWWRFEDVQIGVNTDPQLYSTGADGTEIVPEPPPAFRDIARIGDRLWAIDAEDTSRIWFTKPFAAGYAPEWATVNTLTVGDDCVAIRDLGGFPIVLGSSGIHRVSGVGPDALGNGLFEPPLRLPYTVGCVDRLVCNTTQGIVFRGRRGLYLLEPSGNLQMLGPQVDELMRVPSTADYTYARIVEDDTHNEVLVVDDFGANLVAYNALEQKWSTWEQDADAQNVIDAAVADGRLWYLHWDETTATPKLRRSRGVDEASYANSTEGWAAATQWVKPDGLAGQGKMWRVQVALILPSDPSDVNEIGVQLYNDYVDTVAQTVTWSGSDLSSMFGANALARLTVVPAQQVVTALKVRVYCTQTGASSSPRPLGVRLQYGVRPSKGKRAPGVK